MLIAPQFTKLSLPTHYNAPNLSAKSIIPFFLSVSIFQTNFGWQEIERGVLSVEIDHFVEKSVVIQSWETRTIKIKTAFHNESIF